MPRDGTVFNLASCPKGKIRNHDASTPFHSVPVRSPKVIAERCGVLGDFVVVFCRHKAHQAYLFPAGREGMAGPPLPTPKEFQGVSYDMLRQKFWNLFLKFVRQGIQGILHIPHLLDLGILKVCLEDGPNVSKMTAVARF